MSIVTPTADAAQAEPAPAQLRPPVGPAPRPTPAQQRAPAHAAPHSASTDKLHITTSPASPERTPAQLCAPANLAACSAPHATSPAAPSTTPAQHRASANAAPPSANTDRLHITTRTTNPNATPSQLWIPANPATYSAPHATSPATPSTTPAQQRAPAHAAPHSASTDKLHITTSPASPERTPAQLCAPANPATYSAPHATSPDTPRRTPAQHRVAALALAGLLFATTLAAQPTDLPGWLTAIENTDRAVLSSKATPPAGLAAALRPRIPKMKDQARVLAAQVLEKLDTTEGASTLLTLTADPNLAVAAAASRALRNAKNLPPADELLQVIPKTENPAIRAHLYLAAGRAKTPLPSLQLLADKEQDPQARNTAMAAAIRLGGIAERAKLSAAIRAAKMEDVVRLTDLIVYTGDKSMAPALLPLFDSQEPIFSISPGPNSRMARRCDIAVWTTHQLGLVPNLKLTSIRNFDNATISAAKAAAAKGKDK